MVQAQHSDLPDQRAILQPFDIKACCNGVWFGLQSADGRREGAGQLVGPANLVVPSAEGAKQRDHLLAVQVTVPAASYKQRPTSVWWWSMCTCERGTQESQEGEMLLEGAQHGHPRGWLPKSVGEVEGRGGEELSKSKYE